MARWDFRPNQDQSVEVYYRPTSAATARNCGVVFLPWTDSRDALEWVLCTPAAAPWDVVTFAPEGQDYVLQPFGTMA